MSPSISPPAPTEQHERAERNETKARLLDQSLTLFASKGYAATSVREIIDATGVTRPVLYYYFENKEELFQSVVRWKHNAAYDELASSLANTVGTANRLRVIMRGTFAFCVADPRVPLLMFQATFGPEVFEIARFMTQCADKRFAIVSGVIQEGLDSGELHGGDTASIALLFCSIMDYHANTLSRQPKPEQTLTPELADALIDAFFYGVAAGRRKTPQLPRIS